MKTNQNILSSEACASSLIRDSRDWFKYKSDNFFARGPVVIIPLLALISMCLILIFSSFYLWNGQSDDYTECLWETFVRTLGLFSELSFLLPIELVSWTNELDPGSAAEDTGSIHRLISASVTMCGIFIISTLIGALTTGIEGKLSELRNGRTKVIEKNHTSQPIRSSWISIRTSRFDCLVWFQLFSVGHRKYLTLSVN